MSEWYAPSRDGVFINTAGVGVIEHGLSISPASVQPGDVILLSGDIGRHGIAIMAAREGLSFECEITSDCAPLAGLISALIEATTAVLKDGVNRKRLIYESRTNARNGISQLSRIRSNSTAVSIGESALFRSWALPPASAPMLCIRCARRNCDL